MWLFELQTMTAARKTKALSGCILYGDTSNRVCGDKTGIVSHQSISAVL